MNYTGVGYVYAITNTVNGHRYIGSTTNYQSRWSTHRSTLRRRVHHSFVLQKAWDKYGESAFTFELLVICPKKLRIDYESRLMQLQTYNVMRTPHETKVRGGRHHSAVTKQKMSAAHIGRKFTPEHRANMAAAARLRVYDMEFRNKARARQLGVSPSRSTRDKLSTAMVQARKKESERNQAISRDIYQQAASGGKVIALCRIAGITSGTFYRYCKLMGLPNLKQRPTV